MRSLQKNSRLPHAHTHTLLAAPPQRCVVRREPEIKLVTLDRAATVLYTSKAVTRHLHNGSERQHRGISRDRTPTRTRAAGRDADLLRLALVGSAADHRRPQPKPTPFPTTTNSAVAVPGHLHRHHHRCSSGRRPDTGSQAARPPDQKRQTKAGNDSRQVTQPDTPYPSMKKRGHVACRLTEPPGSRNADHPARVIIEDLGFGIFSLLSSMFGVRCSAFTEWILALPRISWYHLRHGF